MGPRELFLNTLVTLEGTIDPSLKVFSTRPLFPEPTPCVYNQLKVSPSEQPAVGVIVDTWTMAVRVVLAPADVDVLETGVIRFADLACVVFDQDLVRPHLSVFKGVAHEVTRKSSEMIEDKFGDSEVPYTALEIVLEAELRRNY